jgi:hypothetical protein
LGTGAIGTALLVFLLAGSVSGLTAQERPAGSLHDVAELEGIIKAFYEVVSGPAGTPTDRRRDLWLHHPNALVAVPENDPDGKPKVRTMSVAEFHDRFGTRTEPFYEREVHRTVRRFGNMAHVWSTYASSREPNGTPFTRGINSIQLYHDGSRWWITHWIYDRETPSRPIPPEFLPPGQ